MGINSLHIGVTLVSFFTFICIVVWAMSRKNKADFDAAEMLPFVDERGDARP